MQLEARRPRVFIAEDDATILDLLRTRLELAGYETVWARDGREALPAIQAAQPAGVILDIGLPLMDGFEVLTRLQAMPACRDIPVMMLTARHAAADVRRALDLGARDFLTKPFSDAILLARVARLVRGRVRMVDRGGGAGSSKAATWEV